MDITSRLLARRGNLPRPVIDLNFGNASKIQEGATAVDVAGWTGENLKAGITPLDVTQTTAADQPLFNVDHIEFDGVSDYLEGLPTQSGDFTYTIKYKLDTGAGGIILLVGDAIDGNSILFISGNNIQYKDAIAEDIVFASGLDLRDGQTRTISITRSGPTVTCYIDGVSKGTGVSSEGDFYASQIGTWVNHDFDFHGNMYDFLIYPTALNAVEIASKTASLS